MQLKRFAIDTIFGRPITNPRVEGSASLMYSMTLSRRGANRETGGEAGGSSGFGSRSQGRGLSRQGGIGKSMRSMNMGNNERAMLRDMRRKAFEGKYIIDPEDG